MSLCSGLGLVCCQLCQEVPEERWAPLACLQTASLCPLADNQRGALGRQPEKRDQALQCLGSVFLCSF